MLREYFVDYGPGNYPDESDYLDFTKIRDTQVYFFGTQNDGLCTYE